jgi:replicative DNA helicase
MTDPSPSPTPSAAVEALVGRFTHQLEASAAVVKAQEADLAKIAKQVKDPALRRELADAIKEHAAAGVEAASMSDRLKSVADAMTGDLETLIDVARLGSA